MTGEDTREEQRFLSIPLYSPPRFWAKNGGHSRESVISSLFFSIPLYSPLVFEPKTGRGIEKNTEEYANTRDNMFFSGDKNNDL
jgi:hypothetical protein